MVPDEKDRGFPAAFLLSGSMTTVDVAKLFDVFRQLMPECEPQTLVTDEAACFWNGYRLLFSTSHTRLHYCRMHMS
ncbi:hypothetical protein COOONC_24885 [Cooperia oncophora]